MNEELQKLVEALGSQVYWAAARQVQLDLYFSILVAIGCVVLFVSVSLFIRHSLRNDWDTEATYIIGGLVALFPAIFLVIVLCNIVTILANPQWAIILKMSSLLK